MIYFSAGVSVPDKGISQAGKVGIRKVVSKGLTIEYSSLGVSGVVAGFVDTRVAVHWFSV